MTGDRDVEHPLARIGDLVESLERLPDSPARERARDLVQAVLDLHRVGLARLVALAGGDGSLDRLTADPAIALLLSLHRLHPRPVDDRVRDAVKDVGPALLALGAAVELDAIGDELVSVRVRPAGPARADRAAVRALLEAAIGRAAPEIAELHIDGLDAPAVPIGRLASRLR